MFYTKATPHNLYPGMQVHTPDKTYSLSNGLSSPMVSGTLLYTISNSRPLEEGAYIFTHLDGIKHLYLNQIKIPDISINRLILTQVLATKLLGINADLEEKDFYLSRATSNKIFLASTHGNMAYCFTSDTPSLTDPTITYKLVDQTILELTGVSLLSALLDLLNAPSSRKDSSEGLRSS